MNGFNFLIVSSVLLAQTYFNEFFVSIQVLGNPNKEEIVLKIEVKNISDKTVKTFKHRRLDYKHEKIKSLGNYIVEVEKYENGQYSLFNPSSGINLISENQEYISFTKENSITDTIYIDGYSFSRSTELKKGFPSGNYRLRVCFKSNMQDPLETRNSSNWIDFKIE